jgi:hypothetical protein
MAPAVEEERLAPLRGLVTQLRAEVEALDKELEAKRRRLRLAEATLEREQAPQEGERDEGGDILPDHDEDYVSSAAQASLGDQMIALAYTGWMC